MQEDVQIQIKSLAITRQRNFFAGCLALVIIANFLLSVKLGSTSEKTIMVPGITRELMVEKASVSSSYLEETALLFLSSLLDLTPTTVEAKKDMVFRHVSKRSSTSMKHLQEYFAESIKNHQKFQLSTFFAPKKLNVDSAKLLVTAVGVLTSVFGKRGFEEQEKHYKLSFDYVGGFLQLKEFIELRSVQVLGIKNN
jgi:type IV conjugative transfer system protein TraE